MKRLAIITTHPIQYNAPLFAMLHSRGNIVLKVFYTWGEGVLRNKYDPGFDKKISWDIPLLEGYEYEFVKNTAKLPGSHHFNGIQNPGLVAVIKKWQADAVLVYGWSFKSHLQVMRAFHGKIPVLFRGDSTLLGYQNIVKKTARKIFLSWVYSHIDMALYVGTANRKYYSNHGVKADQLVFAAHAVDNERFKNSRDSGAVEIAEWKESLGMDASCIVLLYAGKLDDNKNVYRLAETFNKLQKENVHLLIAGNGVLEEKIKTDFGQNKKIHFLPFQNQSRMPLLYGMAELFVLPSYNETWGLGINEAMACGLAILASTGCGAAEDLLIPGKNGDIFRADDSEALAEKIQLLVRDKNLLQQMGARSLEIIRNWNFETVCKTIEHTVNNKGR